MYSIKEVAQKFDLSIYTLRFYDKKGLLPFVCRDKNGNRVFTDTDLSFIHTICCLKDTGMKLDDIKLYIDYCMQGPSSITDRQQLLRAHRQQVEAQQKEIEKSLQEIDYKLGIYESPEAVKIINAERAYVANEKANLLQ